MIGETEEVELEQAQDGLQRQADPHEELEGGEQEREAERDPDLCEDGVARGAEAAPDREILLEPFEEQLDLPALLVDVGDDVGRQIEDAGEEDIGAAGFRAGEADGAQTRYAQDARPLASEFDRVIEADGAAARAGIALDERRAGNRGPTALFT